MLYAYSEATVPKITVITRKAYGGSYIAMCSQDLRADQVIAWPTAEVAVMGPAGAANIIFKNDPDVKAKTEEYIDNFATPYQAAMRGMVDLLIDRRTPRSHCHQRPANAAEQTRDPPCETSRKYSFIVSCTSFENKIASFANRKIMSFNR